MTSFGETRDKIQELRNQELLLQQQMHEQVGSLIQAIIEYTDYDPERFREIVAEMDDLAESIGLRLIVRRRRAPTNPEPDPEPDLRQGDGIRTEND